MKAVLTHGAPKITMNSQEADYRHKLRAAKQHSANQYINGVQAVFREGPDHAVSDSRTKYGAPTIMPQTVMEGKHSNFEQRDAPNNSPRNIYTKQTGSQELGTSATNTPQQDPEQFETSALEKRLALYASAAGNAYSGLNDRAAV